MNTTTATAMIDQQCLNHYYSTSSLTEIFEVLNEMEFELESILVKEFEQGLSNDLNNSF